jgi:hypothetical protein
MIRTFAVAAAVLLGACATSSAPAPWQVTAAAAEGLTPQEVSSGFVIAVVEGCAAAAEAGKTLEQLGSDRIVRDTTVDPLRRPKPGAILWAPVIGQGIVSIEEVDGKCDVTAYGPPVEATFNAIVGALRGTGYVAQPMPPAGFKFFQHNFTMTANGRTISVALIGNEPGAAGMRSRFSIVSAFVSVTTP